MLDMLKAVIYGIIEGITEWLPVSSTGHMILAEQVMHFSFSDAFMEMFRVVIQLGAILAVVVIFWNKLWPFARDRQGHIRPVAPIWRLWFKIVVASIPAACCLLIDDWIDSHFYNFFTVAFMLILYGVLFIIIENRGMVKPTVDRVGRITYRDALIIGLWQMLAVIPGTSRSGATIVGGLLLGLSRPCVAEFTFYLAIPAMVGASGFKLLKFLLAGNSLTGLELGALGLGSLVAFVVSLVAIRFLMNFVKRHDFKVFGWYRIALGIIVLATAAVMAMA